MLTIGHERWLFVKNMIGRNGDLICLRCDTLYNLEREPGRHACNCGSDIYGVSWVQSKVASGHIRVLSQTGLMHDIR